MLNANMIQQGQKHQNLTHVRDLFMLPDHLHQFEGIFETEFHKKWGTNWHEKVKKKKHVWQCVSWCFGEHKVWIFTDLSIQFDLETIHLLMIQMQKD